MIGPKVNNTDNEKDHEMSNPVPKNSGDLHMLCGPGCVCGSKIQSSKWKVVVMLIILAVVAIALIYKEFI